nr:MAG TPA: collagen triple helix repeat protein [Caudoviricetes sp.]
MVTIEELKLGNKTLEALKFLLSQVTGLEAAITGLNLEELKGIKSAFDDKYNTFDKFVSNLDTLRSELLSKVEAKGDRGEKGEQGERGPVGPTGPKGDRGETGQKGDRGESFSVNAVGVSNDLAKYANKEKGFSFLAVDKGLLYIKISDASGDWSAPIAFGKGEKGDKGDTGPQGIQGVPGVKGDTGAKGERGETGPAGPIGPQGIQGPAGPKGDKGDPNPNAENSQKLGGLPPDSFYRTDARSTESFVSKAQPSPTIDLSEANNFELTITGSGVLTLINGKKGQSGLITMNNAAATITGYAPNLRFRNVPTSLQALETFVYHVWNDGYIIMNQI